jgi:hypothetical protein
MPIPKPQTTLKISHLPFPSTEERQCVSGTVSFFFGMRFFGVAFSFSGITLP